MRYRLSTLLIVSALGPPVLALTWWGTKNSRLLTFLLLVVCGALFLALATVALDEIGRRITKR